MSLVIENSASQSKRRKAGVEATAQHRGQVNATLEKLRGKIVGASLARERPRGGDRVGIHDTEPLGSRYRNFHNGTVGPNERFHVRNSTAVYELRFEEDVAIHVNATKAAAVSSAGFCDGVLEEPQAKRCVSVVPGHV